MYIQVTGPPITVLFQDKKQTQSKKNKKQLEIQDYNQISIDRRQIFYCNYMGRQPGLFRSSFLYNFQKSQTLNEPPEITALENKDKFLAHNINSKIQVDLNNYFIEIIRNFQEITTIKPQKQTIFSRILTDFCPLPNQEQFQTLKKDVQDHINNIYQYDDEKLKKEGEQLFEKLHFYVTPFECVIKFLKKLLKKLIPKDLFGPSNFYELLESTRQFIEYKRFENIKMQDIICKMNIFEPKFMQKVGYNKAFKYQIIKNYRIVFSQMIGFIYNHILIPTIRCNFYVTEKHKEGNKIFYYRKPLWNLITKLALFKLGKDNFDQISEQKFIDMKIQKTPIAKLRLLPKKNSFRPIMTFNRKQLIQGEKGKFLQNINQMLKDTQIVLRNQKVILGEQQGFSVFDNFQIFQKMEKFVKQWENKGKPELHVISLDIQKCYDSINHEKLLKMFEESELLGESYMINKYILLQRNKRPLDQRKNKAINYFLNQRQRVCAMKISQKQDFETNFFQERQKDQRPQIVINSGETKCITKDIIQNMLNEVCQGHAVEFEKNYFTQKFGIPQGLNVSSVLCSFYFHLLEKKLSLNFQQFQNQQNQNNLSLLMRLTDDYIFFTDNKDQAQNLVQELFQLGQQYQFQFNMAKVCSNFDFKIYTGDNIINIKQTLNDSCTWIGKVIRIKDLQITPAFENDPKKNQFSMNVNIPNKNKMGYLMNKLKSLLMNQFQDYFNPKINTWDILAQNIILFSQTAAQKFYPFIEKFEQEQASHKWLLQIKQKIQKQQQQLQKNNSKKQQHKNLRNLQQQVNSIFQIQLFQIIIFTVEEFINYICYILQELNQDEDFECIYYQCFLTCISEFCYFFEVIQKYHICCKQIKNKKQNIQNILQQIYYQKSQNTSQQNQSQQQLNNY